MLRAYFRIALRYFNKNKEDRGKNSCYGQNYENSVFRNVFIEEKRCFAHRIHSLAIFSDPQAFNLTKIKGLVFQYVPIFLHASSYDSPFHQDRQERGGPGNKRDEWLSNAF